MSFHFQGAWCSACYLSDYRAIHEREDGNATSALQGTLRQVETPYIVCMLSHFSCVQLFVTLWIVAHQALLSMGFSRQDYWNALPCPPPRDLPNPRIEPASPALAGGFFTTSAIWKAPYHILGAYYIAGTLLKSPGHFQ